jgi:glucokinase
MAGDVGGTKTVLCLYQVENGLADAVRLTEIAKATFRSGAHEQFRDLVAEFLDDSNPHRPDTVCIGIAGPIHEQRCSATNLPWDIDAEILAAQFGFQRVHLINDLEAAGHGMLHLADDNFVELNPHAIAQRGHMAIIAAGTGLGEAIMAWDGHRHIAMPSEGGHTDFAPTTDQEDALLRFLRRRFGGHVSVERILAGDGFGNLYDFLKTAGHSAPNPQIEQEMVQTDRNAVISRHGLQGDDPLCTEVMRLFVRIYGSEAGNLALKCLPRGGVYIGGGIGPRIRPALTSGDFMAGFTDKGRMTHAIEHIPVRLALNVEAPLLGAAHMALQLHSA